MTVYLRTIEEDKILIFNGKIVKLLKFIKRISKEESKGEKRGREI